jgi:hypothetical protein
MKDLKSEEIVGRVVATEQFPSSPHQFFFWTRRTTVVGIGTLVRIDGDTRTVFGVVVDGRTYSDLEKPIEDVGASGGDPTTDIESHAAGEITLWTAAVLRQIPEEPLQPVPIDHVVLASTEDDVRLALRMETYWGGEADTAIPVGLYATGGMDAPVFLDADFLLGPESAHLNISGISGLATKTSALQFLLASLFQHFPERKGKIAAVCFNVKGPDLCFMDQPGELTEDDLARYESLGVDPVPFSNIKYYAPLKPDGVNLNTLRTNSELMAKVEPLVWGLREVLDYHEVLLTREDLDAKADGVIDFLSERVIDKEFRDDWGGVHRVASFADLEGLFRAVFDGLEAQSRGDIWRTHHIATLRKVRNRLLNISTRCKGLVTDDGIVSDLPFGDFEDRGMYVIDVAGADQLAQDLVFTRVVSKLREHLERRDLGVDQVVVFVDELNKYAPNDGQETYVRKMLMDIAERGRYLGLVLFGAEQFRSHVHRRVTGNAGTTLYGRMDMDELASPGYQVLSPSTKAKLATLPKGELMVRHPHFTQPMFLRFPRPPVMSGTVGIEKFPPAEDLPFGEAVVVRLLALDRSISPALVRDAVEGRREDDVRRALAATVNARPKGVLSYFEAALGSVVAPTMRPKTVTAPPLRDLDDPYG